MQKRIPKGVSQHGRILQTSEANLVAKRVAVAETFLAQVLESGSSRRLARNERLLASAVSRPRLPFGGYQRLLPARGRLDETELQQIGSHMAEQLERRVANPGAILGLQFARGKIGEHVHPRHR